MIYFDNSATTKPHDEVLHTFLEVNNNYFANPASIHAFGVEVNELLEASKKSNCSHNQNKTGTRFVYFRRNRIK